MLADTTYVIDLMRGDAQAVAHRRAMDAEGWTIHVSTVTVHELHRGLVRVRRPGHAWQGIKDALAGLGPLEVDREAARLGGQVDGALAAAGQAIDPEDCMIAGVALREGLAVLTRNVKHFGRVQGLDVVTY